MNDRNKLTNQPNEMKRNKKSEIFISFYYYVNGSTQNSSTSTCKSPIQAIGNPISFGIGQSIVSLDFMLSYISRRILDYISRQAI